MHFYTENSIDANKKAARRRLLPVIRPLGSGSGSGSGSSGACFTASLGKELICHGSAVAAPVSATVRRVENDRRTGCTRIGAHGSRQRSGGVSSGDSRGQSRIFAGKVGRDCGSGYNLIGSSGCLNQGRPSALIGAKFCQRSFQSAHQFHGLCNLSARHIVVVRRQSHSSQNTNDRHNDHQFDKGETLLHVTCDRTTVHSKLQVGL